MVVLRVDLPLLCELFLDYGWVVWVVVGSVRSVDWLVTTDMGEGVGVGRADGGYGAEW